MNRNRIRVGIDPAFRKNGFAICIVDETNSAYFKIFKTFLDFFGWAIHERPDNAIWIVENSNLQNNCWQKNAMAVGKNQAASQLTVDLLKSLKCEVYDISPREKGKVWNAIIFKNMVYTRKNLLINFKNTEDERCAYQLATRNISQFKIKNNE